LKCSAAADAAKAKISITIKEEEAIVVACLR
jgi:hypothetical protein